MTRPPFSDYEKSLEFTTVVTVIGAFLSLFLLLGNLIEGAPPAPWPRTHPMAWVAIPLIVFALVLFVTMRIVSGVVQTVKDAHGELERAASTASTELSRTKTELAARTAALARAETELTERTGELTVLRAGFGAVKNDGAEVTRLRAEVDRLTRSAAERKTADPARKEALVRLLEERAAAREDALLDADDAVREARLAAIDDEFGPKIEAAYDAL